MKQQPTDAQIIEAAHLATDMMSIIGSDTFLLRVGRAALSLQPLAADTQADLLHALVIAEAALSDIGDADREPGDDVAWCEARAAQALPVVRAALANQQKEQA